MIQDTVQLVVLRGFFSIFTGDSSDLGTISTSKYFMNVQNVYQQKHIISAYHQINIARKLNDTELWSKVSHPNGLVWTKVWSPNDDKIHP